MTVKKTKKPATKKKQLPKRAPKKSDSNRNQNILEFEKNARFTGDFNFAGRDIINKTTIIGFDEAQVVKLFDQLRKDIEANTKSSLATLEDLKVEISKIQSKVTEAAKKNEKVDEGFLAQRFRNIARMAPDMLDVVVKTLVHPMLGIGEAAKKIAKKAKEEAKS